MPAPERFAAWLSSHRHVDSLGHVYRYHPRSDAHSIALSTMVLEDLLEACPPLRAQAAAGRVVYGINARFRWGASGKEKTLDLALGPPEGPAPGPGALGIAKGRLADVFLACEAKSVMTEHGKSKPRVYDELSSSHEIVHGRGRPEAIAAGITVVNISESFVSPLRQRGKELRITRHPQPRAAAGMVAHLRGLPIREAPGEVGFDACCTLVIRCDNVTDATLWTAPPAPQPGDRDHYAVFLGRLSRFYSERFGG